NFSQWAAGLQAPLAAPVEVGGRVTQPNGRGIFRARVMVQDENGDIRTAYTNPLGYYRFADVPVGQTYTFSVWHRRYQFASPTQVHSINETTDGINFTASGENENFRPEATFFDRAPFDFDGDGRTDAAVFRSADNGWYVKRSSDNTWFSQAFGAAGDRLAPADFDGDNKTDIAVFRPSNGNWYIWLSASNALRVENFGTESDRPMPSDFDGDGQADISTWNRLKGIWQVKMSSNGATVTERFKNGKGDFTPLATDRDGDGKADFVFFNQSNGTWKIRLSESRTSVEEQFGQSGDRALTGDFDGDGRGDLAVYRAGDNTWSIKSAGGELSGITLGENVETGAAGDFDGDGKTDLAMFRDGVWSIRQSLNEIVREQRFGAAGDTVIPSSFDR
ncbi:MAG: FG-GAP-like repeat-containing protein, partial [Pyrinomonadaceae bacterium]|nr:FG-GAP-like repeat-containing protein [Pyrinomonadaceae bacterium]